MKFRTNSNRFNNFSGLVRSDEIEKFIKKSWKKFDRSNIDKTKAQAFFEEAEGYYARNNEYRTEFCDFNTYLQHLTEAHRGKISDNVLDLIEAQYGILAGPLHIRRGQTGWEPDNDFRNTPRPNGEDND